MLKMLVISFTLLIFSLFGPQARSNRAVFTTAFVISSFSPLYTSGFRANSWLKNLLRYVTQIAQNYRNKMQSPPNKSKQSKQLSMHRSVCTAE
ncbi:hypothetical protein BDV23DRAFT_151338 [Aspergillus alliaceus]|uniref:Uncharacterized protein n=1 Tax=Petromyces alliaceus TaxID=209559 RepID=A0A5N6GB04_PETAA|nr:uncharacterized protein BDW43DRAFT_261781 [Aspergillus alliaceus]KAB8238484.1 hypothetical protein BDW43DRAFT_261781 [Aspergillus alliaceus]KAE8392243.1 hypothetical protein BDV23DRAFT_151338 [Aspergillus alliaceus]